MTAEVSVCDCGEGGDNSSRKSTYCPARILFLYLSAIGIETNWVSMEIIGGVKTFSNDSLLIRGFGPVKEERADPAVKNWADGSVAAKGSVAGRGSCCEEALGPAGVYSCGASGGAGGSVNVLAALGVAGPAGVRLSSC